MAVKIIIVLIGISILVIAVYNAILRIKNKKIKELNKTISQLSEAVENKEKIINKLTGEIEIEKRHKELLAKRIADIDNMSIGDVLHELQNE